MNKIHLIDQEKNICTALLPPIFEIESSHDVSMNPDQYYAEQTFKNKSSFKLYNGEDGKVLFYVQSRENGVNVTAYNSLEKVGFPLTLYKHQEFIDFLKASSLDQNRESFVLQNDPTAPLFLAHSDNNFFIVSDGKRMGYSYITLENGNQVFVFLADYGDEIGMVTDFGAADGLRLEKSLISKQVIDAKLLDYQIVGIEKLCLAVLAAKGYHPQVAIKKPEMNRNTVQCYIDVNHLKTVQPQVISLQKTENYAVDIHIFGEVFAEYTFTAAELPNQNAKNAVQRDQKIMCFAANNDVGVGMIVFEVLEDGALNYRYTYIVRDRLGESVYQWSSDVNGSYMINEVIERILKNNGVAEPKRYVGLIKNEQINPAQAMSIADKVTYAEQKFLFNVGRRKTVIMVEQYGTLMTYDVSAAKDHQVSIMPDAELLQVINQMSVQGSEYTAKVVQVMELLIKHRKLNQEYTL